ncbi:MAG: phosphoglycolate phosphatase [Robiginitomaculum sp.]|nr:MAG: phosphoglycolate phosphatase [Robiginitomaculum sp.]
MPLTNSKPLTDKVIAFDLDGTLIDTAPDLVAAMNVAMVQAGHPETPTETVRNLIGLGARALLLEAHKHHEIPTTEAKLDGLLQGFLDHYARNLTTYSRPFAGAISCLQELKSQGASLTVCTNKPERFTLPILQALDLGQYFDGVFCPDNVTHKKPDAAHMLASIAPAQPQNALMIGDSNTDLAAARNAGVGCFLLEHGYSDTPIGDLGADLILADFDGLMAAILGHFT